MFAILFRWFVRFLARFGVVLEYVAARMHFPCVVEHRKEEGSKVRSEGE